MRGYGKTMEMIENFAERNSINFNKLLSRVDECGHIKTLVFNPSNQEVILVGDEKTIPIPKRELV